MKLFVDQQLYDLTLKSRIERQELFKKWHGAKNRIECGCIEKRVIYPPLHIKARAIKGQKNQYTYSIANNPDHHIQHDSTCPFNLSYKQLLALKGITTNEDGIMECKLSFTKKKESRPGPEATIAETPGISTVHSQSKKPSSTLKTLFMAMLQKEEAHIDEYKPFENRRISNRLYVAARKVKVGKTFLYTKETKRVYISAIYDGKVAPCSNRADNIRAPFLIIGWGTRDVKVQHNQYNNKKVDIPLYSVDDPNVLVTVLTVYESTYQHALKRIEKEKFYNAVNTGYWVLWRDIKVRNKLPDYFEEKELIFIPAEPISRIPVDSRNEEVMLKELIERKRTFKKPLIGKEFSESSKDIRPDFILLDSKPHTMVEVAGIQTSAYLQQLEKKKNIYLKSGYKYLEWKPYNTAIEEVNFPDNSL